MQACNDVGVKAAAVNTFLELVTKGDKQFGARLNKQRGTLGSYIIFNIQQVGIHDYAKEILNKKSGRRIEIDFMLSGLREEN